MAKLAEQNSALKNADAKIEMNFIMKPVKWTQYQDGDKRLATFLDGGHWEAEKDQEPEEMAKCGFFSTCRVCDASQRTAKNWYIHVR